MEWIWHWNNLMWMLIVFNVVTKITNAQNTAEECFLIEKDYGSGSEDEITINVDSYWECYGACSELKSAGCSHFTFIDVIKTCFLKKTGEPFLDYAWGTVTGELSCFQEFEELGEQPSLDEPYTADECFEYNAHLDDTHLLPQSVYYPVLGSGFGDPIWCQIHCTGVPECNYWMYVFWAGKYDSEQAQDVDRAACNLYSARVANPLQLYHKADYITGPRICPGGAPTPLIDRDILRHENVTIRINSGGPEVLGHTGLWHQDTFYAGGFQHAYQVQNYFFFAAMDPLAQTSRHYFDYAIPLPVDDGTAVNAKITLYFAENIEDNPLSRSFNVVIEGAVVLWNVQPWDIANKIMNKSDDYEDLLNAGWSIFAQAQAPFGTIVAIELPLQVVEDGELNIGHEVIWGNPIITMIEFKLSIIQPPRDIVSTMLMHAPMPQSNSSNSEVQWTVMNFEDRPVELDSINFYSILPGEEKINENSTILQTVKDNCTLDLMDYNLQPNQSTTLTLLCSDYNWKNLSIKNALKSSGPSTGDIILLQLGNKSYIPITYPSVDSPIDLTSPLKSREIVTNFGFVPPVSAGNSKRITILFKNESEDDILISSISLITINDSSIGKSGLSLFHKEFGTIDGMSGSLHPLRGPVTVESEDNFGLRVTYAPDNVGTTFSVLLLETDVGTVGHIIIGECVDATEPHFLHPVLTLDDFYIDFGNNGFLNVTLDASFSHTHEPNRSITGWKWVVDGEPLEDESATPVTQLSTGNHSIMLTIFDDENKSLNTVSEIEVYPQSAVGGSILMIYEKDDVQSLAHVLGELDYDLDGIVPVWIHREKFVGYNIDPLSLNIAGSSKKKDIMIRSISDWTLDPRFLEQDFIVLCSVNKAPTALFINDTLMESNQDNCYEHTVEDSTLRLDIRWVVTVTNANGPRLCALLPSGFCINLDLNENIEISHSEENYSPFISVVTPRKVDINGDNDVISAVGYFIKEGVMIDLGVDDEDLVTVIEVTLGKELKFIKPTGVSEGIYFVTPFYNGKFGSKSSGAKLHFMDGAPPPVVFSGTAVFGDESKNVLNPSQIDWGHDGYIYAVTFQGELLQYQYDKDNVPVEDSLRIYERIKLDFPNDDKSGVDLHHNTTGNKGIGPNAILGFAIDPFSDPAAPHVYVASSPMFAQGGSCFDFESVHAPFDARIDRLIGPDYEIRDTILTGVAISNHDHGVNGMSFDNDGRLYFLQGVQTNFGWPTCILGGLPESHYTGALNRLDIRRPWHVNIDYIDHSTGVWDRYPNQVIGDIYAPAPWMTGIETFSAGFRNAFDHVFTQEGRVFVTQNGFNEGYGEIVDGKPECDVFTTWDVMLGGHENPYGLATCSPPVRPEFSEPDRLFEAFDGSWHGCPNPPYARNVGEDYIWTAKDAFAPNDPPNFYQGLAFTPSLVGITEWKGSCFKGEMKGDLLMQKWNGWVYRAKMPEEERPFQMSDVNIVLQDFQGVDVQHGPGCTILGTDFTGNRLLWSRSEEPNLNLGKVSLFDVFPWRANSRFQQTLRISGLNFNSHGKPVKALISSIEAISIEVLSDTVLLVLTPPHELHQNTLGNIRIDWSDGYHVLLEDSFLWRYIEDPYDIIHPGEMAPVGPPGPLDYQPYGPLNKDGTVSCGVTNGDVYEGLSELNTPQKMTGTVKECRDQCSQHPRCNLYRHERSSAVTADGDCQLYEDDFYDLLSAQSIEPAWKVELGPPECREIVTTTTTTTSTTSLGSSTMTGQATDMISTTTTTTTTISLITEPITSLVTSTTQTTDLNNISTTLTSTTITGLVTSTIRNTMDVNGTTLSELTSSQIQVSTTSTTSSATEEGEEGGLSGAQIGGIAAGSVGAVLLVGGAIGGVVYTRANSGASMQHGSSGSGVEDGVQNPSGSVVEEGPTPRRPYAVGIE